LEKKFTGYLRTSITPDYGSQEGIVVVSLVTIACGIWGNSFFFRGYEIFGVALSLKNLGYLIEGTSVFTSF